jgi:Rod binding domain-containing protein
MPFPMSSVAFASSEQAARAVRRRASPSPGGLGTGLTGDDPPETPKEAAEQFEKVLVRQFVDVMTEDMYSSSLAGGDGKNWMSSQRDRQRRVMTGMITDKLTEAGNLQISETLMQSWGTDASAEADAPEANAPEADDAAPAPASPENSIPEFVDPLPAPADPSTPTDRPQIDHVV